MWSVSAKRPQVLPKMWREAPASGWPRPTPKMARKGHVGVTLLCEPAVRARRMVGGRVANWGSICKISFLYNIDYLINSDMIAKK